MIISNTKGFQCHWFNPASGKDMYKKDAVERCFMLSLYKPAGIMRCSFPWRPLLMFWSPTPTLSLWHPARESFQMVAGECAMASSMRVCKLLPQDPSVYLGVSENEVYPPSGSLTRKWRFTGDKPTPCNANSFLEAPNVETMTISATWIKRPVGHLPN